MSSKEIPQPKMPAAKSSTAIATLMTPNETARVLQVSLSWLAKARMRGDGPPYLPIGRSIRYAEAALIQWMKSKQRSSTSEIGPDHDVPGVGTSFTKVIVRKPE
jgi:predicted DNA-binding transcriptional regulator AlpA